MKIVVMTSIGGGGREWNIWFREGRDAPTRAASKDHHGFSLNKKRRIDVHSAGFRAPKKSKWAVPFWKGGTAPALFLRGEEGRPSSSVTPEERKKKPEV